MKKWGLRILSATLTFTAGTGAVIIAGRYLKPALIQSVRGAPNINLQLPPPQIAKDTHPTDKAAENSQPTDKGYKPIKPRPVSISPYEIKLLVDQSNNSARRRKGYELDFESIWNQLDIKPDVYTDFRHADISTFQLDNKAGEETVLRLYADMGWQSIYLIFKKGAAHSGVSGRWILLGYSNAFTWIDNPQLRVVSVGADHWLVVRHCAWHGSGGYYREDDNWYEVSDKGVIPVLSYYNFDSGGMNPSRESHTKILKSGFVSGVVTVVLQVSDLYKAYAENGDSFPLWEYRKKVTFIRRLGTPKFVPDRHNSEMSEEEICALSDSDGHCSSDDYDTTHFLQYNYQEIEKIVARGNGKQKEWLRNFLKYGDESVEKQSLQKVLEGARP